MLEVLSRTKKHFQELFWVLDDLEIRVGLWVFDFGLIKWDG
jgi:hypothetical protein